MKKAIYLLLSLVLMLSILSVPFSSYAVEENIKTGTVDTYFRYEYNCDTKELIIDGYGNFLPCFLFLSAAYKSDSGYTTESGDRSITPEEVEATNSIYVKEGSVILCNDPFSYAKNLEKVTIPSSVKRILRGSFHNLSKLQNVYYGGSEEDWKKIQIDDDNEALKNVTVHYNTDIPDSTYRAENKNIPPQRVVKNFTSKGNFKCELDYYTGIATISGKGAMIMVSDGYELYGIDKLFVEMPTGSDETVFPLINSYVFKEGITSIGDYAFNFARGKTVYLPKSLRKISSKAFGYTDYLSDIYYAGTITQWNNIDIKNHNIKATYYYYDDNLKWHQNDINLTTHFTGSKTGWITESKKTYYLTEENTALYGLQEIGSKKYIFKKTTGELLKGKVSCDGFKYIMSKADGHMMFGKVKCDGKYYITNKKTGKIMYGLVQCDGKKYITDSKSGEMKFGKVKYKGKYYIASKKDGHLFINTKVKCDGKYYRTDKTGAVKS